MQVSPTISVQLLITFCYIFHANCFINPVFTDTEPFSGLSVTYKDGLYYLLSGNKSNIVIRTSNDLQTWTLAGSVINGRNRPIWITGSWYLPAEIVIYNNKSIVYFANSDNCIRYASAPDILGEYFFSFSPLLCGTDNRGERFEYPSIYNNNGTLILYYVFSEDLTHYRSIEARVMQTNAYNFEPQQPTTLLTPDPQVEGWIETVRVFKHGDYFYLLYFGGRCQLYVARSLTPLGPFERYGRTPLATGNGNYFAPSFAVVTKDQDGNDVLLYATEPPIMCSYFKYNIHAVKLQWTQDGWPKIAP